MKMYVKLKLLILAEVPGVAREIKKYRIKKIFLNLWEILFSLSMGSISTKIGQFGPAIGTAIANINTYI